MSLILYNTLKHAKEEFKPLKEGEVTLYTCGPTTYNYVHIGNLRAMLSYDILKRYLLFKGFKVKHVMNITDVDDKTIRDSIAAGKSLKEYTSFYNEAFFSDISTLGIMNADIVPKATEEIESMISLISTLLEKGHAYKTENGDVYFKISSFDQYGKLANLDNQKLKENADGRLNNADEYGKEDAHDFALWKAHSEEDGDVCWDAPFGRGRPGWHIECSAMASKYLGQPFDIHMGGVDLIFPHHTNEIAQSECAHDSTFCNYWVHNAHLIVNGEKMSKSAGNFFTLRDLLSKGYDARSIRYELLSAHYRQELDFREDKLKEDSEILQRFKELLVKLDHVNGSGNSTVADLIGILLSDFEKNMDDDLNIQGAINALFVFVREINKVINELDADNATAIVNALKKIDTVLGILSFEKEDIPSEVIELAEKRLSAKKDKQWDEADKLRDEITALGYQVDDTKDGYLIKKS